MSTGNVRPAVGRAIRVFALLLFGIGLFQAGAATVFVLRAQRATGVVVGYHTVDGAAPPFVDSNAQLYYARVDYFGADGTQRGFVSPVGRRSRPWPPGTEVPVYYLPGRSGRERLARGLDVWGGALIFLGLAALFTLISFAAPRGFRPAHTSRDDGR